MRINENMNLMRNHIASIAQKNIKSQRKIQEVRNQRLFGTEPVYTIADMMDDLTELNQEQYEWFMDAIGPYNRERVQKIYEQVDMFVESAIACYSNGLMISESFGYENEIDILIEAQAENVEARIKEYERRLSALPADDKAGRAQLQKTINQAKSQLGNLRQAGKAGQEFGAAKKLQTGTTVASRKPRFGSAEDAAKYQQSAANLKAATEKVEKGKTFKPLAATPEEGKYAKLAAASRAARGGAPKPAPEASPKPADAETKPEDSSETKPEKSKFRQDYEKHRDLMLGPAGSGLKYYLNRAKEIGGNVIKGGAGLAVDAGKAALKGIDKGISATGKGVMQGAARGVAAGIAGTKALGRAVRADKVYKKLADRANKSSATPTPSTT